LPPKRSTTQKNNMPGPSNPTQAGLIRARALTGFADLVARHGGDVRAMLAAAGLAPQVLDAPDSPLALTRMAALLHAAASSLGVPDFGLQLARSRDINVLGPVALFARHAATVGDACAAIQRNLPYHTPGMHFYIGPDPALPGYTEIRFTADLDQSAPLQQITELWLGMVHNFLSSVTRDDGRAWRVEFRHSSTLPASCYRQYFSGTVCSRQPHDRVCIPTSLMAVEVAPGNSMLQEAAERYVSSVIRRFPLDIVQQVEGLVDRDLASGGGNLVQVAGLLGLHERTLQRRLKEHGVFFEDIVDRVRRRRAEEFLSHPAIPLAQVASLLGYTEQSSFIRVCKRWFATTPQAYRARRVRGQAQAVNGRGSPTR
jgi:AraC-like DNA-binding protein